MSSLCTRAFEDPEAVLHEILNMNLAGQPLDEETEEAYADAVTLMLMKGLVERGVPSDLAISQFTTPDGHRRSMQAKVSRAVDGTLEISAEFLDKGTGLSLGMSE